MTLSPPARGWMQLLSPASLAIWQFEEIEKCMPRDKALRQEIDAIVAQMLAEPVSKMAFRKLERDGVNSRMLGRFLVFIASLPKLRRRKEWRGMAWYTFERFPARLRALANQIDDINAHPALTPKKWAAVVSSKKRPFVHVRHANFSLSPKPCVSMQTIFICNST